MYFHKSFLAQKLEILPLVLYQGRFSGFFNELDSQHTKDPISKISKSLLARLTVTLNANTVVADFHK